MNNKQTTVQLNLNLKCNNNTSDANVSLMGVTWDFTKYTLAEFLEREHESRFKANSNFVYITIELLQPVSEDDSIVNELKNYCKEHNITLMYYPWYNTSTPKFYNMCAQI